MYGRVFAVGVVLFWLSTMSWLLARKVLPPLLVGDPPKTLAALARGKDTRPIGWHVRLNDSRLGWALSTTKALPDGGTQINGRVHFERLNWNPTLPSWLGRMAKLVEEPTWKGLSLEATSAVMVNAQGALQSFRSTVRFQPLPNVIDLVGSIDGGRLFLRLQSGDFAYETSMPLASTASVEDGLTPQTKLPGLKLGQRWTIPIYSPLKPPTSPLEILEATVSAADPIVWDGEAQDCWLVTYRTESGGGWSDAAPRGRVWVRHDGEVLRQEVTLLDATLTFERLNDEQAETLVRRAGLQ